MTQRDKQQVREIVEDLLFEYGLITDDEEEVEDEYDTEK